MGSSPHTRGAPHARAHRSQCRRDHPRIRGEHVGLLLLRVRGLRIIPAYAGSTARARRPPTLRGGSSPHTRGAPRAPRPPRAHVGIIPAYAGSTSQGWFPCCGCGDHPRIRGEHAGEVAAAHVLAGIIPAYAGSTGYFLQWPAFHGGSSPHTRGAPSGWGPGSSTRRDHPRIRGEHIARLVPLLWLWGSSPHTRGALKGESHIREDG